jgi:hypothetical protein
MLRDNDCMSRFWRQWLPGSKHGVARVVVVHGSPGFQHDAQRLADLLADCRNLRAWAREHGVDLDDTPGSLAALDQALDRMNQARGVLTRGVLRGGLTNDAGLYLGTVLVRHLPPARWQVWPNGHPVIRLPSGRDLDVVAAVNGQGDTGQSDLALLYTDTITGDASRSR